VDLALFRRPSYGFGAGIGLVYFAGFTGIFFTYAQYLQEGVGYSALASGLAITPFALGSAVTSFLGGRVVTRYGRPLVLLGLVLVTAGLVATYVAVELVPGAGAGWAAAGPLLVAGIGSGLVISPNQALSLSEVPVVRAGSAGAVLQTGQRIGSAAGIAVTGSLFFGAVADSRGDFALGFRHGLWAVIGLVALATVLAAVDVAHERRGRATADA
jgi:MFS family permease